MYVLESRSKYALFNFVELVVMRDANKSFSKIVQNALCVQRSFEFTLRKVITKWVNLMVYTSSCQKGQKILNLHNPPCMM